MMSVSRVVYRLSKPLWGSVFPRVSPVMWPPCRAITTNKDYVKFGNVGGKMKIPDPSEQLNIFVGKWNLQGQGDKSHITYERHNGVWSVDICNVLDNLEDRFYCFRMGLVFNMERKDNTYCRVLAYQEGDHMRWQLQSKFGVADITHILMVVRDRKLVWYIVTPDRKESNKIFVKP